ncbi:hypothetical protein M9G83_004767 [Escherichia coli]|nr:hypothetical protein [Escherichia coli]
MYYPDTLDNDLSEDALNEIIKWTSLRGLPLFKGGC